MTGTLYLVATPIGNLKDITIRAKEILETVDLVACEDTRVTGKLLHAYEISKPLMAFHQHSDVKKMDEIVTLLKEGKHIALTTDAGTPAISDPGGKLVEHVYQALGEEANIEPIPGASAVATALSVAGYPADKFCFFGFPPQKKGRAKYFKELEAEEKTIVIYESTHRIMKTLDAMEEVMPNRKVAVCRELTKQFETIYRGSIASVKTQLEHSSTKGEFAIVIAPKHY